jgi:hypothetical protein
VLTAGSGSAQLSHSVSSFEMETTVKLIILSLLFFGTIIVVSAQTTLYDTYSDGGKTAFGRGQIAESERLLKAALKEAENLNN